MNFNEEYAEFSSVENYSKFAKTFSKLSEIDQQYLIAKLKYETYEEKIERLYEEINSIQNLQEFDLFLLRNHDLKVVRKDDISEIIPAIQSFHVLRKFFNGDQIIKIENEYYKFISNLRVKSADINELQKLKNIQDVKNSGLVYIKVTSVLNLDQDVNDFRNGDFNPYVFKFGVYPGKCRDRRETEFNFRFGITVDNLIDTKFYELISAVIARRQGWTCTWYRYKTEIDWKDIEFNFENEGTTDSETPSDKHCDNCQALGFSKLLHARHFSQPAPDLEWNFVYSWIKTRGIHTPWTFNQIF